MPYRHCTRGPGRRQASRLPGSGSGRRPPRPVTSGKDDGCCWPSCRSDGRSGGRDAARSALAVGTRHPADLSHYRTTFANGRRCSGLPRTTDRMTASPDPTALLRLREGVYLGDLVIAAIAELDLFTKLGDEPRSPAEIAALLGLDVRATAVMCEALETLELLERDGGKLTASATARAHLVAGAPGDLRPYFASLRERPAVRELADVLRTGRPAAWASAAAGDDWAGRLDDPGFAEEFTAAMDARARVLAPALAQALADVPARRVLDIAGGSGAYGCALLDGRAGASGRRARAAAGRRGGPHPPATARIRLGRRRRRRHVRGAPGRPTTCTSTPTSCTTGTSPPSRRSCARRSTRCPPAAGSSTTTPTSTRPASRRWPPTRSS